MFPTLALEWVESVFCVFLKSSYNGLEVILENRSSIVKIYYKYISHQRFSFKPTVRLYSTENLPFNLNFRLRFITVSSKPNEYCLHYIFLVCFCSHLTLSSSVHVRYKPVTHYSSQFAANNNKTTFLQKKIEFRETWWKEVYTLFVIDPSFYECIQQRKIRWKKFFEFVRKLPTLANAFRKMLTNWTNHSLHTIRVLHEFCPFVPFSSLFANSV